MIKNLINKIFNLISKRLTNNLDSDSLNQQLQIILKNQCLKFKIQGTDLSDKRVFLGNFVTYPNIISSISAIKIYVFDKDNRIIDV